jgi:hypothetical protein
VSTGKLILKQALAIKTQIMSYHCPQMLISTSIALPKVLITITSLHLVGEGLLELDAPVRNYLTNFLLDTSITLRHLLSHISGLADYGRVPAYSEAVKANPTSPWPTQAFLDLAYSQGLHLHQVNVRAHQTQTTFAIQPMI